MNEPRIVMTEEQWQRERQRIRMYVYAVGVAMGGVFVIAINLLAVH